MSAPPTTLDPRDILYEDNHCLAVSKPARLLTVADETGDPNLLDLARDYLKQKYRKPGNVFLGLVHRLDRPASGVVLFARTSKAAARLSDQFRRRSVTKVYQALVAGRVEPASGRLEDWLLKNPQTNEVSVVAPHTPEAKAAALRYRVLACAAAGTRLEIELETGRSHQVRVQLASRGWPIQGDAKYGSTCKLGGAIALHAASLTFEHPTKHEAITLTAAPPAFWGEISR